MTIADEKAAKWLREFLDQVEDVLAVGRFYPSEIPNWRTLPAEAMLRGARSHARAAFAALERGDLDLFRTLHSATRDLLLDAERRQSDVLAEEAVEAEREIRWRGPRRAAETAHKARAELDADAWEAAQELRRQAPRRGGRLNVAKLAEIISSNDPRLGTPETIEKRLRRSARSQGFDLDEWADRGT